MKIKLLLAALVSAVTVSGAVAGPCNYCPPPAKSDKCPVECCPDSPGYVGVSYASDYIFRGVRYSRETVGMHASYTIDNCFIPVTLGVNHYSSLTSTDATRTGFNGDHSNLYAALELPSICGFDLGLRYDHYLYPNRRGPGPGAVLGDSHGALGLTVSREIFCGVTLAYTAQHDFNSPANDVFGFNGVLSPGPANRDNGAWIHTLDLSKSFCITDCIALDLSGGVVYSDNLYGPFSRQAGLPSGSGPRNSAGWNNYYLEAALPIAVGRCATLTPYIGYNGTPDGWQADGVANGVGGGLFGTANANDVLHGGVRLGVKF